MASTPKEPMEALKCQSCNAPLTVSPDDVVITCNYCGFTATLEGEKIENHFVLPPTCNANDIREKVRNWVGRGGKAQVTEAVLRFVPFWVESMHAVTEYEGYKQHTETEFYTDSQGRQRSRTKTYYEPIRGTFDESPSLNILCRRGATFYSQDEMDKALHVTKANVKSFNFKDVTAVESNPLFLNSELDDNGAYEIARTNVEQEHRSRAESRATKIWDCHSRINKTGSYLLHVPHWLVRYKFGTETYRVGIDGFTKKVLKGEVPVSTTYRGIMCVVSIIGLIIGAVGGQMTAWALASQDWEFLGFVVIFLGLVIAAVATNQTFKISAEKRE
ncbi:MAG: hypothetical protein ACFFDP_01990 [Promethearchaeota archaeon]